MKQLILILSLCAFTYACDKEETAKSCYDESLVHDGACTADCPGFIGCDGKMYCNECEAARLGIGPQ